MVLAYERDYKLERQRYRNREKITTRKSRGGHDETWKGAKDVIEILQADGQSDDQTETEDVYGHRVVRCVRRPWLNSEICSLVAAVDSYSMELKDMLGVRKQGNVGLTRIATAKKDDDRPYMVNLPINFYDTDWYRRLDEYEKADLNPRPEMDIPMIVRQIETILLLKRLMIV